MKFLQFLYSFFYECMYLWWNFAIFWVLFFPLIFDFRHWRGKCDWNSCRIIQDQTLTIDLREYFLNLLFFRSAILLLHFSTCIACYRDLISKTGKIAQRFRNSSWLSRTYRHHTIRTFSLNTRYYSDFDHEYKTCPTLPEC